MEASCELSLMVPNLKIGGRQQMVGQYCSDKLFFSPPASKGFQGLASTDHLPKPEQYWMVREEALWRIVQDPRKAGLTLTIKDVEES